ncbi:FliI/YscN family ATPase [Paragemmobacter ruber]|uniref:FliI/YscN family ATPase n=1 Tax=Paragemmobacter ruber TaxID=1985673 RepID=A0ABW9Y4G3_9RHOB|nr:FliI/YscN family ATPase [Rhodobacter ruber]NBE07388.1 FliI/YscN family ATPase [Rhodobacter ruber]
MPIMFDSLRARIAGIRSTTRIGRVAAVGPSTVQVTGLSDVAALGDRVFVGLMGAEVIALGPQGLTVLPDSPTEGISIGDPVGHQGPAAIAPDASWIGRILDPDGQPLDGRPLLSGLQSRPLRASPPAAASRRRLGERLATGLAAFDTMLPLVQGQRLGLFAGSGVGKSTLLGSFARHVAADVVIVALVGERGREVRAFAEDVLGAAGLARSVIIAATSDQSPLVRRRCPLAAMAVAEHFRDQGAQVLLLCDSITRFAEAHREVAAAGGEPISLGGWPPSLSHAIMSLAERAGPGGDTTGGDITAIFTVLVAGSNMEEPVADILRGVLDGHVILDRAIAERGRFPAVNLLRSLSRSLPDCATDEENTMIAEARRLLSAWDRAELMVQSGLYSAGSDSLTDRAIRLFPQLDAFLAETAPTDVPGHAFQRLRHILSS